MGCELSRSVAVDAMPRRHNSSESTMASPFVTQLDEYQMDIIGSTLPLLAHDSVDHGCAVFLDIFTVEPRVQKLFPFRTSEMKNLAENKTFRHHARMFMDVVIMVCENMNAFDEDSDVSRELMLLGAQHASIAGCELIFFNIFAKCLHLTWEATLGEEYTDDVRSAWTIIFQFIIKRMRDGYSIYMQQLQNGNDGAHFIAARRRDERGSIEEDFGNYNRLQQTSAGSRTGPRSS